MAWPLAGRTAHADPSALWNIVNGKCVPHQQTEHNPAPCVLADLTAGYIILKDMVGATQFLAIPTARTSGIEAPSLLAPGAPNYWDDAWRARHLTEEKAGHALPREALSLAVNSTYGRSQDQLHIHIDCIRADVRDALAAHRDAIGPAWSAFPVPLSGLHWRALRVDGADLGDANPFRLLADGDKDAAAAMGKHTLVVVGMTFADGKPGFAVLDDQVDLTKGDFASSEVLQDHDCDIAR
jgi:CDP-diacylglycerol pyrophosphatase